MALFSMERNCIRYHWKRDGVLRVEPDGQCRYLTIWQTIRLIFGAAP